MGKLGNTLLMLKLLQGGRKYSIKELSEIIEVSPRQIRTYKEELEKAGIYINSLKGRYGGYVYDSNEGLSDISFDISEINTLEHIAIHLSNNNLNNIDIRKLNLIIEKLRYIVLYSTNRDNCDNENSQYFYNILSKAINQNKDVILSINKTGNKNRERQIKPHSIYVNKESYYITGFCNDVGDIRTFPFSDIKEIIIV